MYGEPRSRAARSENRRQLRTAYRKLFDLVSALLFRHDPIGINFGDNTDEYECEVETILPLLRNCNSAKALVRVVHEEFVRWFDADIAGPPGRYQEIASEIWKLWLTHRSKVVGAEPPVLPADD
jgi:hypothetical protein